MLKINVKSKLNIKLEQIGVINSGDSRSVF